MNTFSSVKELLEKHIRNMEQNRSAFVKDPERDFTRNRKLSFFDTVMLIVSMECGTIRSELLKYFSYSSETATSSAFIQQRDKLTPDALRTLFYAFSNDLNSKNGSGYHFFAVDGSDVLIPMEREDKTYAYFKREDQRAYHQIHLSAVYDLINSRYAAAYIEPRKGHNERSAFDRMFEEHSFPSNSVFVFDRGYEGYPLMAHISGREQFFVIRAKDNRTGGILKGLDLPAKKQFDTVYDKILVPRMTKKRLEKPALYHRVHHTTAPYFLNESVKEYPLKFRVVRFHLGNGTYECLLTNLPQEQFSLKALKKIYKMRWGIETSFRHLKYSIGLLNFHTKKAESIRQEIWARLILYNFCMAVVSNIRNPQNGSRYSYRPNIANAVHVCRRFLKLPGNDTPPNVEQLISGAMLPVRPDRKCPRIRTTQRPRKFNYRVL